MCGTWVYIQEESINRLRKAFTVNQNSTIRGILGYILKGV